MEGILAPWHWAILIVVVLLIFGPRKLPELGNSLGKSIRGFKKGLSDAQDGLKDAMADTTAEAAPGQQVAAAVAEPSVAPAAVAESTAAPAPSVPNVAASVEDLKIDPPSGS